MVWALQSHIVVIAISCSQSYEIYSAMSSLCLPIKQLPRVSELSQSLDKKKKRKSPFTSQLTKI